MNPPWKASAEMLWARGGGEEQDLGFLLMSPVTEAVSFVEE